MSESSWNAWFDAQLEQLTTNGRVPNPALVQAKEAPPADLLGDLHVASRLANLNLDHETKAQAMLRTRLAWMAMIKTPHGQGQARAYPKLTHFVPSHYRIAWMMGVLTVFMAIFLTAFSQPALVMAQHMLGYGYLPEVGFFPLSKTLLLKAPVEFQQNQPPVLLIQQGITLQNGPSGPGITWLWLEGDPNGINLSETWLDLAGNKSLPVQSIKRLGNNQTRLEFGILPFESTHSVLRLAGEIKIPLTWIPALEAGLAPTQVFSSELTQTPIGKATLMPCLNITGQLMLCVHAAFVDSQGTHLLLELQPIQNGMSVHGTIKSINQSELQGDAQIYQMNAFIPGNMDGTNALTLQFAPIPQEMASVTLHLAGIHIQQDGKEIEIAGPVDLALHFPACSHNISPTPSVFKSIIWKPVPTPAVTSRP